MSRKNIAKTNDEMLSARVPADLKEKFWATVPIGSKNQHIMTAAIRLWISLPDELRKRLISAESITFPKKKQDSYIEAIRQIFSEQIIQQADEVASAALSPRIVRQVFRQLVEDEKQSPGTIIKILSQEDATLIADVRKALRSELKRKKKSG